MYVNCFKSKMANCPKKPLSGPLQRAMAPVENSLNQLHVAGEGFHKVQLQELSQENDANHLHELSNKISPIHWLALALSKVPREGEEQMG